VEEDINVDRLDRSQRDREIRLPWLVGSATALLYLVLSSTAMHGKSAVYDEAVHLLAGWRGLTEGDRDFNHEHPPLMKALAAAPIVLSGAAKPIVPWSYRREFDEWPLSHAWLYHVNDGDRLLRIGRLSIACVGAALGFLVCLTAWSLAGPWAGCAAALLYCLEPNLLAHGSLVTTDMGMTALFFATLAAFRTWLERGGRGWMIATGLSLGLALLAKFTAILLPPILVALALFHLWERRAGGAHAASSPDRREAPARQRDVEEGVKGWRVAAGLAAIAAIALVVLNAGYGFEGSFSSLSEMKLESERPVSGVLGSIPIPAPRAWIAGYDHARAGGERWWSYLMGMHSMTGWRHYYIVALLVKTPIPLLLLAAAGAFTLRRTGLPAGRSLAVILPPAVLVVAFALFGDVKNIGVRYVLPVYPFLCVLGGAGVAAIVRWRTLPARITIALLAIWLSAGAWRIYPDHLAYFNEIAGGPERGRWWLLDSNLDWGQDLKGLGAWIRAHDVKKIYVDYFGQACAPYYGVVSDRDFEGGLLAVSATNLGCVYREDRSRYDFLEGVAPVAVIGRSIYVYDVPRPPSWTPTPEGPPD
jgi:hypothetical protein